MKLRDALGAAPESMATNPCDAWGYAGQVTATRLADGHVRITAYKLEGEWFERDYSDIDAVDSDLYTDPNGPEDRNGNLRELHWPGPDEWEPLE